MAFPQGSSLRDRLLSRMRNSAEGVQYKAPFGMALPNRAVADTSSLVQHLRRLVSSGQLDLSQGFAGEGPTMSAPGLGGSYKTRPNARRPVTSAHLAAGGRAGNPNWEGSMSMMADRLAMMQKKAGGRRGPRGPVRTPGPRRPSGNGRGRLRRRLRQQRRSRRRQTRRIQQRRASRLATRRSRSVAQASRTAAPQSSRPSRPSNYRIRAPRPSGRYLVKNRGRAPRRSHAVMRTRYRNPMGVRLAHGANIGGRRSGPNDYRAVYRAIGV